MRTRHARKGQNMEQSKPADYYTTKEVADRMGVSKMTIYRMVNTGQLPGAVRFGRSLVRVHKITFDLWLAELQDQGAGDGGRTAADMDDFITEA
jgi:excisionase family DNA binding protein